MLLARVKKFLQNMLPVKQSEEEYLNKAVARILISMLDLKTDASSLFSGRSMIHFTFSSMALLKELNGVLAYWLTEEHSMNKHVKVPVILIDHRQLPVQAGGKPVQWRLFAQAKRRRGRH